MCSVPFLPLYSTLMGLRRAAKYSHSFSASLTFRFLVTASVHEYRVGGMVIFGMQGPLKVTFGVMVVELKGSE